MDSRFAKTSEIEAEEIRRNMYAKNTVKSNKKAARLLKAYLLDSGRPVEFETMSPNNLNQLLKSFYLDARKCNGSKYKTGSMENFRHALNRYLNSVPFERNIDLIKDNDFREANISFSAMLALLKREGYGETKHYPAICDSDLTKIYSSRFTSVDTPTGIFNKVQFDIRLYFFRRGAENMHKMTKSTFAVLTDPGDGTRYVAKVVDELTKNHRQFDKENSGGGRMPEIKSSPSCPVKSFQKYISKLNPLCDKLWQRAMDSFLPEEHSWFCNVGVGEKRLQKFMPELSRRCELSQVYSNHCVRATGATILSKLKFNPAQIMSVTGHKSVSSLSVYQKVSESEKLEMGQSLANYVFDQKQPSSSRCVVEEKQPQPMSENMQLDNLQLDNLQLDNLQLDDWNLDVDFFPVKEIAISTNNEVSAGRQPQLNNIFPPSVQGLFNNCQINNLHIHLPK